MQDLRDRKYRDTAEIARRFELNDASRPPAAAGSAIRHLISSRPSSKVVSRIL
jgi:hypothetical protein